jgi:sec-independent protein translocase protein TatB
MLDFDAGKLIVLGIVALVAIPSKDLPRVLRQLGQLIGRTRRMAAEFQGQLLDALNEAELLETKKQLEQEVKSAMSGASFSGASFDPMTAARKEMNDLKAAVDAPVAPAAAPPLAKPEPGA